MDLDQLWQRNSWKGRALQRTGTAAPHWHNSQAAVVLAIEKGERRRARLARAGRPIGDPLIRGKHGENRVGRQSGPRWPYRGARQYLRWSDDFGSGHWLSGGLALGCSSLRGRLAFSWCRSCRFCPSKVHPQLARRHRLVASWDVTAVFSCCRRSRRRSRRRCWSHDDWRGRGCSSCNGGSHCGARRRRRCRRCRLRCWFRGSWWQWLADCARWLSATAAANSCFFL